MNWKAFWGILGLSVFIIYVASTIYQLINWDGVYWELIKNIVFCIVGLSLFMEWRKNRDGELMTDAEEKQVYQEWQDKKEDNSTS
jgi:hypothetical protein